MYINAKNTLKVFNNNNSNIVVKFKRQLTSY